ncbi:MAG: NAD(P)H-hydrate dehydratase [Anaerolineales bacterium]|nr:NAD(P)H-hydrate dehydratase [Anaerolineales bacterium]
MNLQAQVLAQDKLVSVAEMQAIEAAANAGGHPYAAMMEMAGYGVAEAILARFGPASSLVLVGPGNNGGDGLVCARHLAQAGATVRVYLWKRQTDPERDSEGLFEQLRPLGIESARADDDPDFAILAQWSHCHVIVDALLGTGNSRSIEGQLAAILDRVAQHRRTPGVSCHVVAVDCASGLYCDTGAVDPHTLRPDITVTFAHAKLGHYLFPGADCVGELAVVGIGVPPELSLPRKTFVLTERAVAQWLPERQRASHKGVYGKVLLMVGSELYPGAAYLSCAAAGRVGAGLVTGVVPRVIWPIVASKLSEATWLPLGADGCDPNGPSSQIEPAIAPVLASYTAMVAGCGLGRNPAMQARLAELLQQPLPPVVIDADGLNNLADLPHWPAQLPHRCVLTPHPTEMARLCGFSAQEVLTQRWVLAREKAAAWQCVVLLKGPYTVIASPDGWLAVLPVATAALATAGTGDVLAGAIGGLLAQGVELFRAACLGAWLHGAAGLRCAERTGDAGVLASDLLPELPLAIQRVRKPHASSNPSQTYSSADFSDLADHVTGALRQGGQDGWNTHDIDGDQYAHRRRYK